jgi:hypothetical protein
MFPEAALVWRSRPPIHCQASFFWFFFRWDRTPIISAGLAKRNTSRSAVHLESRAAMTRKTKSSRRNQAFRAVIVSGFGAMTVLAGAYGTWLLVLQRYETSKNVSQSAAAASTVVGDGQTTVILSTPNTSDCWRYQLNLATGVRSERGPMNCADQGGNRLESISKAFRNR